MTDRLRVRAYNVRFGDAILVTVPDRDPAGPADGPATERHVLIDVGNTLNQAGGVDAVFKPVVEDILQELGGKPLDLYVMTHEHLDHVQGLYYADRRWYPPGALKSRLQVNTAWLTASAAPDYYQKHPEARRKKLAMDKAYREISAYLGSHPAAGAFQTLLAINDPRSTKDCVDFLRDLAAPQRVHYVYAGLDTTGKHPFREVRFELWAPAEDTSSYYATPLAPMALTAAARASGRAPARPLLVPPPGVDAGSFYDLVDARSRGFVDNLLAIDKAANNTSVVFLLEWRGWRLLFAGDAELASWQHMQAAGVLKPVDFLKVSHHGSHNGTPNQDLLDQVLPPQEAGSRARYAVIQTWEDTYSGIPHAPTNAKLAARAHLQSTVEPGNRDQLYMDTYFRA